MLMYEQVAVMFEQVPFCICGLPNVALCMPPCPYALMFHAVTHTSCTFALSVLPVHMQYDLCSMQLSMTAVVGT